MYQDYARQVNRDIQFVDATPELSFPVEAVLDKIEAVQPSFFILSNPHNPTGHRFDESYLLAVANRMKQLGGYLVIDEAYIDFSTPLDIALEDHILVMRTLSKAYAMAGLRLGVLIGTEKRFNLFDKLNTLTRSVRSQWQSVFNYSKTKQTLKHSLHTNVI